MTVRTNHLALALSVLFLAIQDTGTVAAPQQDLGSIVCVPSELEFLASSSPVRFGWELPTTPLLAPQQDGKKTGLGEGWVPSAHAGGRLDRRLPILAGVDGQKMGGTDRTSTSKCSRVLYALTFPTL